MLGRAGKAVKGCRVPARRAHLTGTAAPRPTAAAPPYCGGRGDDRISAAEWAERLGTIPYEVCCGIGERVPRRYIG